MSSNDQEHRISYKAGITRTPSDFLCQDGELAECINLTTDNEELKPIVMPAEFINAARNQNNESIDIPTFLYIHKYNDIDTYIGYMSSDDTNILVYGKVIESTFHLVGTLNLNRYNIQYEAGMQFASIGKVLIVSKSDGLYYFMWKKDGSDYEYDSYGKNFPAPKVEFKLTDRNSNEVKEQISSTGILYQEDNRLEIALGEQKNWNDVVIGLYTEIRKKIWQKKKFHGSFFVRAALELHTGDYYMISNPVFMLNHFSAYGMARIQGSGATSNPKTITMRMFGQELNYKFEQDYTEWSDIVKNVVLFVTREADLFDLTVDEPLDIDSTSHHVMYFDCDNQIYHDSDTTRSITSEGDPYIVLRSLPDTDLKKLLKSGIYYKLCEIGLTGDGQWHAASENFDTHTIENLTTQERIEEDDYYSHCNLMAEVLFPYNSRLNIAGVSRGLFEGFGNFMPFTTPYGGSANPDGSIYEFLVTISTDTGDIVVSHTEETNQIQGIYFYYPDPRAKHVVIKKGGAQILNTNLMEHPALNGAYYFGNISPDMVEPSSASGTIPSVSSSNLERLPNYIITSEVNNPFMFGKKGYNKVGTGKILAISSTTMALNQEQFGKNPLIVFSESGVWGMSVDRTGLFEGVDPFTRDVLINPHNVTQTDGAVFFVSKRGLMVVTTDNVNGRGVRCVSEFINGKPFSTTTLPGLTPVETQSVNSPAHPWHFVLTKSADTKSFLDFIRSANCRIAYDYIDSQLLIINPDKSYDYILNIKDGTISKSILPFTFKNIINNYPDFLLQAYDNTVYSFYNKQKEEDVQTRQLAFVLTRPMKLSGPVSKASLRQLKNVGFWDEGTQQTPLSLVKTELWLSDDMKTWYQDESRFGAAAKYYRLAIFIKMLPSERLSGTIITTQDRRTNNFR